MSVLDYLETSERERICDNRPSEERIESFDISIKSEPQVNEKVDHIINLETKGDRIVEVFKPTSTLTLSSPGQPTMDIVTRLGLGGIPAQCE